MRRRFLTIYILIVALMLLIFLLASRTANRKEDHPVFLAGTVPTSTALMPFLKAPESTLRAVESGVEVSFRTKEGEKTVQLLDVTPDDWFAPAVQYAVAAQLMETEENVFRPQYGITRGEFALLLHRYFGSAEPTASHYYGDLPEESPLFSAVAWADEHGLMSQNENVFRADDFLTCEEAMIVFYRAAGKPEVGEASEEYPYGIRVSDAGKMPVAWAWNSGLIRETGDDCVWYPTQAISRAQVAELLRVYDERY